MAVRKILHYPDKRLHTVAKPVKVFDAALEVLVRDMADTMYDAPGVGLAATQIDVHLQVIVIDVSEEKNDLMVLINPEILEQSTDLEGFEEGCLSVPGFYGEVDRPAWVKVKALDIHGKAFETTAEGLLAVCIQHEMDHLKGKVFVQHLSTLKQTKAKSHMKKYSKSSESHA